jgi:hypothetical protein
VWFKQWKTVTKVHFLWCVCAKKREFSLKKFFFFAMNNLQNLIVLKMNDNPQLSSVSKYPARHRFVWRGFQQPAKSLGSLFQKMQNTAINTPFLDKMQKLKF